MSSCNYSAAPADIAKLRHLYANLKNGGVRDTAQAKRIADGLLAPIIERLELYQAAPKAAPVTQQAGYAEVIECGNSYAKVKLKGEAFGSTRVGDIFYAAPQPSPDCHHRPPCDECAALAAQGGK